MGMNIPRKLLDKLLRRKPAAKRASTSAGVTGLRRTPVPTKSLRFGFGSIEPDGAGGLVETVRSSPWLELRFPLVVVSEPNTRGHWSSRYSRTNVQRNQIVALELLAAGRLIDQLCGVPLAIEPGRRLTITLTRLGSREIDSHDNLRTAFKATVDEIAKFLGVDDADRRLIWKYAQAPDGRALRDTEVVIRFEVSPGGDS